jgi:hypothetical protein
VTPVRLVVRAGQAGGYNSNTSFPESLSDFSRPWNKNTSKNTTCKEEEPFTNPSKTTPNRLRTDQQHHDPKTHESSSSPEANPTSGLYWSDRSHTPVRPVKPGQLGMNSTRGSTPSNPNLDLPNRSTDLCKTLGIVGTPHRKSIANILSTKTRQTKRKRRNPAKNSSNPRAPKTPKSSLLTHRFGRGIKGKITMKGSHIHPPPNPQEQGSKNTQKIHQERAPKITTKNKREEHNQALRNHAESSIHTKEIHTRSSLPPDHPTLSQDLTMKLSS